LKSFVCLFIDGGDDVIVGWYFWSCGIMVGKVCDAISTISFVSSNIKPETYKIKE